jgi:CRP/FNR family transcriptional regulator
MTFVIAEKPLTPIAALRRVPFLKALPDHVLADVAARGGSRLLNNGEMVFAEHQPCVGLIVVLTGAVRVFSLDRRGREMTLDRQEPGESILELPLFDGGNYPASAVAATEETSVFIVPRATFQQLMVDHPELAGMALRYLAIRMRRLLKMLEAQALHTVQARLAAYLLHASDGCSVFKLSDTNEAIGSSIGTVRDVVSRTLRGLKEQGAVDLKGRTVAIVNRELLCRIAEL